MARLLSWPVGLKVSGREPLSGPRAVSAGATTSIGNYTQTYASPFALWRWRFVFPNMRGQLARRYRGWLTAMHGGANATRVEFCDWDGLSRQQMGVQPGGAQNWSNGQPWTNGLPWGWSPPLVSVASASALDTTTVSFTDEWWGHGLDIGDMFGFGPFHFGMYMVTQVIEPGTYRIWPPLRKAIASVDYATLRPVMAMRLEGEDAGTAPRDAAFITGASVTLVEALDYDVRDYWTD